MNLITNLVLCGALAALTVVVAIYRKYLEDHCDHYIHLHNDTHDAGIINAQSSLCRKLDVMDKLKTGLLAATIVYALCIAIIATYNAWSTPANL